MKGNLLIIGAGMYGVVAKEIAENMQCFEKIAFADDKKKNAYGLDVIGTIADVESLVQEYDNIVVAIGNAEVRLSVLEKLAKMKCNIVTLISPQAYVSPSARVMQGCIVEPMTVIHSLCVIERGCIISAGAVVNHGAVCKEGVHVDCNATVMGYAVVPAKTKIVSGEVFKRECDDISQRTPQLINGKTYNFDDVM